MICASFDLDNTLIYSDPLIIDGLKKLGYIVSEGPQKSYGYEFEKGFEPPVDFQWDFFFYRLFVERFDELKPIDDGVVQFMKEIYRDGKEAIKVVSSRPEGILMHHCTMKTLSRCFPDIDFSLDIVGDNTSKLKYVGGNDIFFEDRPETIIEMASHGMAVFKPRHEYNVLDRFKYEFPIIDVNEIKFSYVFGGAVIEFDSYIELLENDVVSKVSCEIDPY
jgi:hypothetical protein